MADLPPWDGHATDPAQCVLLASLVRCQRPEVAVEAGTYLGHTAYHIAHALRENGRGHLHTADPDPAGHLHARTLEPWATFHRGDFLDMLTGLPAVDFAYIDASGPTPDGAKLRWQHFEAVRAKLRPNGIICVDDTWSDDWADGEGGKSVERIRDACGLNFRFLRGLSVYSC